MIAREFVGQNTMFAPPVGYNEADPEVRCGTLPVAKMDGTDGPLLASIWQPTADELARLNAGWSVRLIIFGNQHPPVSLDVVAAELLP